MSPLVGLIMGSDSDWPTVQPAAETLAEFGIPLKSVSFLRTAHPKRCWPMPSLRTREA